MRNESRQVKFFKCKNKIIENVWIVKVICECMNRLKVLFTCVNVFEWNLHHKSKNTEKIFHEFLDILNSKMNFWIHFLLIKNGLFLWVEMDDLSGKYLHNCEILCLFGTDGKGRVRVSLKTQFLNKYLRKAAQDVELE
jgi:hypothetical protein